MNYLIALLVAVLGITGMVLGEADDSPGLQLIGVVLIVGAIVLIIRTAQRSRKHVRPPLRHE
jgi:uncharacterized membrane protein YfcA